MNESEFLLYQSDDGRTRVEVRFAGETAWLSLAQMAELFQRDRSVIFRHIKNVFEEGELRPEATVAKFATVQREGEREVAREVDLYNLDVIISVGYRVKSLRGTQFRIWATQRLREYIVKGFTLDDERLKRAGGGNYFDELLARIRDIRSSEKVFWRKVLDIYATSIDYDPRTEASQRFFATVQNKMHWAAHGHTAAEVIAARADAAKPNMVNAYLELAELQALNRRPMYMADWIAKLDDFLRLSEREILQHAGEISHDAALTKAEAEYARFSAQRAALPSRAEKDFDEAVRGVKQIEKRRPSRRGGDRKR